MEKQPEKDAEALDEKSCPMCKKRFRSNYDYCDKCLDRQHESMQKSFPPVGGGGTWRN